MYSEIDLLTTLTAGIDSQFLLSAKDEFNVTTLPTNPALLIAKFDLNDGSGSSSFISTFQNLSAGQYAASIGFTRSGKYLASVGKLIGLHFLFLDRFLISCAGSGLSSNVYSGSNHFLSVKESIPLSLEGPPIAEVEWNSAFEIIWNGFIILPYQGNVTFQSVLTNNQDRVAIWMDNQIIFDQWSSIDKLISSWNFHSKNIDSSHPILVRFSHRYGYCKFDIKWSWTGVNLYSIPVTQLFSQISHIQGSPFDVVIVPGKNYMTGPISDILSKAFQGQQQPSGVG